MFKEEEEAIKVDLHEGCGRTKLFWVMALADSKALKAMVEFREGTVWFGSSIVRIQQWDWKDRYICKNICSFEMLNNSSWFFHCKHIPIHLNTPLVWIIKWFSYAFMFTDLWDSVSLTGKSTAATSGPGRCRFCGTTGKTGVLAIGNVCSDPDCQVKGDSCWKRLYCFVT